MTSIKLITFAIQKVGASKVRTVSLTTLFGGDLSRYPDAEDGASLQNVGIYKSPDAAVSPRVLYCVQFVVFPH